MATISTDKAWESLTLDEKLEQRFDAWNAAPGINFESKQAEDDYKGRTRRFTEAMMF